MHEPFFVLNNNYTYYAFHILYIMLFMEATILMDEY